MPSLKDIRLRIKSVETTRQTTKAMKMVSASKLRRAQDAIMNLRPYADKLQNMMSNIMQGSEGEIASPYAVVREPKKVLHVVITSNRGLCGAFNSAINRMAQQTMEDEYGRYLREGNTKVITIGKKAYEHFSRRNFPLIGENHDVFSKLNFDTVNEVAEIVMQGYIDGEWDRVLLYYNKFKNVATQIRTVEHFLPVSVQTNESAIHKTASPQKVIDFIYEPQKEQILTELIPKILKVQFYRAVLESNVSEHGARMLAMDNATENANELIRELKLSFNKARQAAITKEILEIVGGAEALSGG